MALFGQKIKSGLRVVHSEFVGRSSRLHISHLTSVATQQLNAAMLAGGSRGKAELASE
jgi:hypothetical protein